MPILELTVDEIMKIRLENEANQRNESYFASVIDVGKEFDLSDQSFLFYLEYYEPPEANLANKSFMAGFTTALKAIERQNSLVE